MNTQPSAVHPRFALTITVMVREASGAGTLAQLKNISLSGCYLETPRELKEDARVRVLLQTANLQAEVWGVVRRRDGPASAFALRTAPLSKTGNGWKP
jgi:PilZ domain